MTRSHDNARSRVNECQLGPTVSNDGNRLLGNKRRRARDAPFSVLLLSTGEAFCSRQNESSPLTAQASPTRQLRMTRIPERRFSPAKCKNYLTQLRQAKGRKFFSLYNLTSCVPENVPIQCLQHYTASIFQN